MSLSSFQDKVGCEKLTIHEGAAAAAEKVIVGNSFLMDSKMGNTEEESPR